MLGFMGTAVVAEASDRIEITFRVGEHILSINGNPVEVETPYVVDGVTLVPVRVITEAFGAGVEWIAETQQTILTYRNVEIVLQIDNIDVYVNEQRQTLLFQPQLTNGVTMIPLRFITENFGAEVGWDEDTQAITVVKDAFDTPLDDIADILRRSNMPMVGDSFLGWSMRRASDMELYFRQFDGKCNIFSLGQDVYIDIDHFDNSDNETFAAIQAREMTLARANTLIGQNVRRTAGGAQFVATQYRDRNGFIERRVFLRPDNQIVVITTEIADSVTASEREAYLAIVDTFDFVFRAAETEDLADVVNGLRLFDNRDLSIQFRLPAEWWEVSTPDRTNFFHFGSIIEDYSVFSGLSIEVVSRQSGDSAVRWARETLESSRRRHNPNTHTHTAIRTMQVGGEAASYFQRTGRLAGFEYISRSIFWEYEDFMYNLYITVPRGDAASIQRMVDSVSFGAIDIDVVGVMARMPIEDENAVLSTVRNTSLGFSISIPAVWGRIADSIFFDGSGMSVIVQRVNEPLTNELVADVLEEAENALETSVFSAPTAIPRAQLSSSALRGYMSELRFEDPSDGAIYVTQYFIASGNVFYLVTTRVPEHLNSPANRETLARIVRSFVVN